MLILQALPFYTLHMPFSVDSNETEFENIISENDSDVRTNVNNKTSIREPSNDKQDEKYTERDVSGQDGDTSTELNEKTTNKQEPTEMYKLLYQNNENQDSEEETGKNDEWQKDETFIEGLKEYNEMPKLKDEKFVSSLDEDSKQDRPDKDTSPRRYTAAELRESLEAGESQDQSFGAKTGETSQKDINEKELKAESEEITSNIGEEIHGKSEPPQFEDKSQNVESIETVDESINKPEIRNEGSNEESMPNNNDIRAKDDANGYYIYDVKDGQYKHVDTKSKDFEIRIDDQGILHERTKHPESNEEKEVNEKSVQKDQMLTQEIEVKDENEKEQTDIHDAKDEYHESESLKRFKEKYIQKAVKGEENNVHENLEKDYQKIDIKFPSHKVDDDEIETKKSETIGSMPDKSTNIDTDKPKQNEKVEKNEQVVAEANKKETHTDIKTQINTKNVQTRNKKIEQSEFDEKENKAKDGKETKGIEQSTTEKKENVKNIQKPKVYRPRDYYNIIKKEKIAAYRSRYFLGTVKDEEEEGGEEGEEEDEEEEKEIEYMKFKKKFIFKGSMQYPWESKNLPPKEKPKICLPQDEMMERYLYPDEPFVPSLNMYGKPVMVPQSRDFRPFRFRRVVEITEEPEVKGNHGNVWYC